MQVRALILFLCGVLAVIRGFSQSKEECMTLLAEQDSAIAGCEKQSAKMHKDIERLIESNKTSFEKYLTAKEDIDRYKFYAEQRLKEIKALQEELAVLKSEEKNKDSIDILYQNCLDSPGTTAGMRECADKAQAEWDKELNKYYNLLTDSLSEDEKAKLKTAQKNWIAYRDSEEIFMNAAYYNMGGTMYWVTASDRNMDITRKRALELRTYYFLLFDYENYIPGE